MVRFGYPCISLSISEKYKKDVPTTNRTMIKKTFDQKGVNYASELALKNCTDLNKILKHNKENNITFFRLSSGLFPWASEYNIDDLKDIEEIREQLSLAGSYALDNDMRITAHPGPFNKLCSEREDVVFNTILDLEIHGKVFDMMGLSKTPFNKINIHLGGAYGDKEGAVSRFINNFARLSDSVRDRLTVENDDKESLYSTKELVEQLFPETGIPIVHDQHHHSFCSSGLTQEEAMALAFTTWPKGIKPVIHYSESLSVERNDSKIKPQAHSDWISSKINTFSFDIDVMIESKMKDLSLLKYLKDQNLLNS
jgi:UV DNA damage endonuclease